MRLVAREYVEGPLEFGDTSSSRRMESRTRERTLERSRSARRCRRLCKLMLELVLSISALFPLREFIELYIIFPPRRENEGFLVLRVVLLADGTTRPMPSRTTMLMSMLNREERKWYSTGPIKESDTTFVRSLSQPVHDRKVVVNGMVLMVTG